MESTIAAISTAYGEGGIGIIRISGEKAKEILCGIFTGKDNLEDRKMIYGHIKDPENGEIIDEVMAVYMKAPKTYTKEDIELESFPTKYIKQTIRSGHRFPL